MQRGNKMLLNVGVTLLQLTLNTLLRGGNCSFYLLRNILPAF